MSEYIGTIVNEIETIDSKIESLTTQKEEIIKSNHDNLLLHDLKSVKKAIRILDNLKTENAKSYISKYDLFSVISDVSFNLERDLGIYE